MKPLFFLLTAFLSTTLWTIGSAQTARHLENLKQLTNGGSNGESYWSPDSKRIIFQSTRGEAQCDQEYIMNADGSGQRMVSTGKGATTCGYFLSDNKHILYASTHEGNPSCPLSPDRWSALPSIHGTLWPLPTSAVWGAGPMSAA